MTNDHIAQYFRAQTGERSARAIAAQAGLDASTVTRQLNGRSALTVETVVAICRRYPDIDMAAAFVAAGFITEEEAKRLGRSFELGSLSDRELTKEIVRRLETSTAGPDLTEPVSADVVQEVLDERGDDNVTYLGRIPEADLPEKIAADKKPRKGKSTDHAE